MQQENPEQLVFLDEAGATTAMTRSHGRGPRGQRVVDAVPHGDWRTTTMIGAIRLTGGCAALAFEGATDTEAFVTFLTECLGPQLRPGDVVIMDNLSCHKSARVAQALKTVGAEVRYLPPYSPDFNPIEKMWSKVKTALRTAARRSQRTLWNAIGQAMRSVTAENCRGYFAACGLPVPAT